MVNQETDVGMDQTVLTLGFAQRAPNYKRDDLLFHDLGRLRTNASQVGSIQVIYAGKTHPRVQGDGAHHEDVRGMGDPRQRCEDRLCGGILYGARMINDRWFWHQAEYPRSLPLKPLRPAA
ncbi:MAG: hypothetical protein Q8J76_12460 [Desulfobulbaceae bacterium]|nr:hypothetical protein [Desulfobulbaceae bacterium]